ncbi:MAG: hypothetical protein Kow0068_25430 [Marinilabiliales bacterium]
MWLRFIFFAGAIFYCLTIFSQENLGEQYIQQINGKLDLAKKQIDTDLSNPSKSGDPQTWYLAGYIYAEISKSEVYAALCDNPANTALKAIQKCIKLDTEGKYFSDCLNVLFQIGNVFYDKAIKAYNKGIKNNSVYDFQNALDNFKLLFETIETMGDDNNMINHLLKYNNINPLSLKIYAGYCAQKNGDIQLAKDYYNELIDMESPVSIAKTKGLPLAYIYMSDLYLAENNVNMAKQIADRGVHVFPENNDMLITAINLYFQSQDYDKLAEILEVAKVSDSEDIKLLVLMAGAYNKLYKSYNAKGYESTANAYLKKAIETYDRVIAIEKTDKELLFKVNYNCGLLYYNPGVKLYIKHDESNKEEWTDLFTKAEKYLSEAHRLKPEDTKLTNVLMKIYQCLNQTDKAKELEEELYK